VPRPSPASLAVPATTGTAAAVAAVAAVAVAIPAARPRARRRRRPRSPTASRCARGARWQDNLDEYVAKPFTDSTGIDVEFDNSTEEEMQGKIWTAVRQDRQPRSTSTGRSR